MLKSLDQHIEMRRYQGLLLLKCFVRKGIGELSAKPCMVCPFCVVDASGHLAFTEHRVKDWILVENLVLIVVSVGIDILPSIGRSK